MKFIEYTVQELVDMNMLEKPMDGNHGNKHPKNSDYVNQGVPFIMVSDIVNGKIDYNKCKFISKNQRNKLDKGFSKPGDILLSHKATIGVTTIVDNSYPEIVITPQLTYYTVKEKIDKYYLKYYFDSPYFQNILKNWATSGSTRAYLGITAQLKLPILLPNLQNQHKIARILATIDKKIELNTQINNNLYEIGKAIYQEYFENEKYTSSYEIKQLSEVTTNNRNKIDKTKEYKVLSAVNTGKLVLSDEYFDKQVYSKDIGKYLNVNKNDFAYNPARINIGSIGLNDYDFNCCVSPVYVTFSVDKDYIDFFDFYFKSKRFNAEVTLRATGSVRQALNYNDFGMIEIPYPTKEMIEKFNSSYKTIKERININKTKISNLEQLRDTLLPKLMNGKIDLDKIEI